MCLWFSSKRIKTKLKLSNILIIFTIRFQIVNDTISIELDHFEIDSLIPDSSNQEGISDVKLVVVGGAVGENESMKTAFSLLNKDSDDTTVELITDIDVLYLYYQLQHKTTILQSMTKNLPNNEESRG